jgi:cytochrome c peroxidase
VGVGRAIFFDKNLSLKKNQACASCHDPAFGFTSPVLEANAHGAVLSGSVRGRFAIRKPPSAAYAAQSPIFGYDPVDDAYVGGNFWDGRATGDLLGNPAADQALNPFVGSAEQALPDLACVIYRVSVASYLPRYVHEFGPAITQVSFPPNTNRLCGREGTTVPLNSTDRATVIEEYNNVARAIAAFELSPQVSAFNSKYDAWLEGRATLTPKEQRGFALYAGKANCAACHPNAGPRALMTDFTFDNIGVPANPENPQLIANGFVDIGLGGFLHDAAFDGAQKVPTIRNLDLRRRPGDAKAYMHNGVFKSIAQVVHFYNTRDVLPACAPGTGPHDPQFGTSCWPAPEVLDNVNRDELGNLGMTADEESDLVAYLKTLSDRRP